MCSLHTLGTTVPLIRETVALPQSFRCLPTAIVVTVPPTGTTKGLLGGGHGRGETNKQAKRTQGIFLNCFDLFLLHKQEREVFS